MRCLILGQAAQLVSSGWLDADGCIVLTTFPTSMTRLRYCGTNILTTSWVTPCVSGQIVQSQRSYIGDAYDFMVSFGRYTQLQHEFLCAVSVVSYNSYRPRHNIHKYHTLRRSFIAYSDREIQLCAVNSKGHPT